MHGATGTSYDFGARLYDSRVGRWWSLDPLAVKYPYASPYVFGLDNPIYFLDPNGMEVDPTHLKENDPEAYNALKADLESVSGLSITEGKDGKWQYSKEIRRGEDGKKLGSRTARREIRKMIDSRETISVFDASGAGGHGVEVGTNNISWDGMYQSAITFSNGITDKRTFGPALNFFHEARHTVAMGDHSDPFNGLRLGRPDKIGNQIRRQLGMQERASYGGIPLPAGMPLDERTYYIPFSRSTKITLFRDWDVPMMSEPFIMIPVRVIGDLMKRGAD
jgi:RHS repeat-associated protein